MKNFKVSIIILLAITACKTAQVTEPIIFSVADTKVPTKEFLYVYNKNNFKDKKEDSIKALKEYLDLFVNFKLKVKEAEKQGLDTTKSFKDEFEGYKKQLVQPYLTDKKHLDSMVVEAYERMKKEVNASHILVGVSPSSSPADTLKAYNYLNEIRQKAVRGEDFGTLARKYSADSSAKFNQGNLGYFTAMQMVYPFETKAYQTKVNEISDIVRTQFGYHIIKVNDVRPAQGKVQVAHIMLRRGQADSPAQSNELKQKVFGIYDQLKKGANWNDLVKQFSEDLNSKEKGGTLDWFGVGSITPSFENAAFGLEKPGDFSAPVETPYGWHILKLIGKKSLEPFNEVQSTIRSKINKESRSEASKELFISKLKKEYNFKEEPEGFNDAQSLIDSLNLKKHLPLLAENQKNKKLFELNKNSYKISDFYSYLTAKKPTGPITSSPYKDFVNQTILQYEESRLPEKYEDFRMLVKEYREGILLFTLMDENVWSKAMKDTVGLKNYFEKNKAEYLSKETADVLSLSFSDSLDMVKTIDSLKKNGSIEDLNLENLKADLNKHNPLRVDIRRDSLEKSTDEIWNTVPFKTGEYSSKINGRYTFLKILDIFKPNNKNFEDIRGQVISDYQKYLEDEWIKELKKKYPVQLNQKELKKLGLEK
jgi:peptidyl-prolyl cis-trans isomerase SurA